MASRVPRIDLLSVDIELLDAAPTSGSSSPGRGRAWITPEGYLEVDAFVARDGLLVYSDGQRSWNEYRDRAELVRAAPTFANVPITDDHPSRMVSAATFASVVRGVVIGVPTIVELDGVTYLRAHLSIRDAGLVSKVKDGQRQLSIGCMVDVAPQRGTYRGDSYEYVQLDLAGNHIASVERGRAGPSCAILLDGRAVPMHAYLVPAAKTDSPKVIKLDAATLDALVTKATARKAPAPVLALLGALRMTRLKAKADEIGMPTTMSKIVLPSGEEVEIPTALAAIIESWVSEQGSMTAPAEAAATEAAEAVTPDPAKPDDKDKDMLTKDAAQQLVDKARTETLDAAKLAARKRSRLDREAAAVGIKSEVIDTSSDVELARLYISAALPHAKAQAAKLDAGPALDALVELAHATPRPTRDHLARVAPIKDAEQDAVNDHAAWLVSRGVR